MPDFRANVGGHSGTEVLASSLFFAVIFVFLWSIVIERVGSFNHKTELFLLNNLFQTEEGEIPGKKYKTLWNIF